MSGITADDLSEWISLYGEVFLITDDCEGAKGHFVPSLLRYFFDVVANYTAESQVSLLKRIIFRPIVCPFHSTISRIAPGYNCKRVLRMSFPVEKFGSIPPPLTWMGGEFLFLWSRMSSGSDFD